MCTQRDCAEGPNVEIPGQRGCAEGLGVKLNAAGWAGVERAILQKLNDTAT